MTSYLTIYTTGVSAAVYVSLNWIKPSAGKHTSFREVDMSEGTSDGSGRSSPADGDEDKKINIYTTQA